MKKFIILTTLLLSLIIPSSIYAQEENISSTDTEYFDITIERTGQSAWSKAVTYTVYVIPKVDSAKTQIFWDAPTSVEISHKHDEFIDMYKGETYTLKAKAKAINEGSYEISVNLIAWQYDTNYTNSVSDIVTFDENLIVIPKEQNYTYSLILKYVIILIASGSVVWGIVILGKKGLKALKKWLTPPT